MKKTYLEQLQSEIEVWGRHNFPGAFWQQALMGIAEEVGELNHALLKQWQGIRTNENHEENAKDAIGDILIFLIQLCVLRGWSFEEIVEQTWSAVQQRDWKRNSVDGNTP
jgi:NTP pyrophosphatase (non-canonical NTP hydrolase)